MSVIACSPVVLLLPPNRHELHSGSASPWAGWLSSLPKSAGSNVAATPLNAPLFWSREEMDYLLGSSMYSYGLRRTAQLTSDYDFIFTQNLFANHPSVFPPDSPSFSFEMFKYAHAMVLGHGMEVPPPASAQNTTDGAPKSPSLFLVPGIERIRHSSGVFDASTSGTGATPAAVESEILVIEGGDDTSGSSTAGGHGSNGMVRLYTHTAFRKGQEVFFDRGNRSNSVLLLNHGPDAMQGFKGLASIALASEDSNGASAAARPQYACVLHGNSKHPNHPSF